MTKLMSERDAKTAIDIADTITHFRRDCGCFPTKQSMKEFIEQEAKMRPLENRNYAMMMAQDILEYNGEWFDKECEPE